MGQSVHGDTESEARSRALTSARAGASSKQRTSAAVTVRSRMSSPCLVGRSPHAAARDHGHAHKSPVTPEERTRGRSDALAQRVDQPAGDGLGGTGHPAGTSPARALDTPGRLRSQPAAHGHHGLPRRTLLRRSRRSGRPCWR